MGIDFGGKVNTSDLFCAHKWCFCVMIMAADIDTRAITRRLREDGSLIGVLSTDQSKPDKELLEMAKSWKIVGKVTASVTSLSKEIGFQAGINMSRSVMLLKYWIGCSLYNHQDDCTFFYITLSNTSVLVH